MQTEVRRNRVTEESSRADSYRMFDRISPRYDFLNHLLSFGRDRGWRREVSRIVRESRHQSILDLACGTCDLILSAFEENDDIHCGIGIDMAGKMLSIGKEKVSRKHLDARICLVRGDGMRIPLGRETVDLAMIAFGIRNMNDPHKSLSEIHRVLKSGGRLVVLEFSIPKNRVSRVAYLAYFRYILPLVGGILSRDLRAYRYLNRTVENFFSDSAFGRMMENAGFRDLRFMPLTFGITTIYSGDKG